MPTTYGAFRTFWEKSAWKRWLGEIKWMYHNVNFTKGPPPPTGAEWSRSNCRVGQARLWRATAHHIRAMVGRRPLRGLVPPYVYYMLSEAFYYDP